MSTSGAWYYLENDQRQGPFTLEALKDTMASKGLNRNTLVWCPGLIKWLPAHQVVELADVVAQLPPPVPAAAVSPADSFADPQVPQTRPWVRFAAKTLDMSLMGFLLGVASSVMGVDFMGSNDPAVVLFFLGVVSGFLLVLFEGLLLSTWGTTPGKALLQMRLRRQDGTLASFDMALWRSLRAFSTGLAFNLPGLSWLALMYSYGYYTGKGSTPWDEGWRVEFGKIGAVRGTIAVVLIVAVYFFGWREIVGS